jgi:hypothetical protein
VAGRITHHSTGLQKQARLSPIGKLLVKERYHPKEIPFLLLAPVSLVVIKSTYLIKKLSVLLPDKKEIKVLSGISPCLFPFSQFLHYY